MRAAPFLAAFGLLAASLAGVAEARTTLLHNAKIYTVNSAQPWASALVIDEDGSIVAIGSDEDVADGFILACCSHPMGAISVEV